MNTVASYRDSIRLIAGTAHLELAQAIAGCMDIPLCDAIVGRFPDGEIDIKINDDVRGADCFVLQPLLTRSFARYSSNSGCDGGAPFTPKSLGVATVPCPN